MRGGRRAAAVGLFGSTSSALGSRAASRFAESVADSIKRLDHLEVVVDDLELLAQPLDVAVDGAVVDIDLLIISRIHQRITAFHHARPLCQRMQDEELGDGQYHRLALPGAGVAFLIHHELAALERAGLLRRGFGRGLAGAGAAQDGAHALDQQTLRERLLDEVVGTHLQAEQLVDLVVLGGQEDHRQVGLLAQPAQKLHAVHARHLDVEDGEVWRTRRQAFQRRGTVGVGLDPISFRFQCDRNRCQDVAVVVDQGDCCHFKRLPHGRASLRSVGTSFCRTN